MKKQKSAGALFIAFPLLLQIPFTLLSIHYHYPDILREPASLILQKFREGGPGLIAMWYAYALSILIFVAALLSYKTENRALPLVGIFSAAVQFIALLRWTFLVPFLAKYDALATTVESKETIEMIFTLQNNFLGVGLGEHVGQLSLVAWTLLMIKDQAFGKMTQILGLTSAVVLLLGLSEHLAVVFPFSAGMFAHGALVGFILWSFWLIAIGIHLIRGRA